MDQSEVNKIIMDSEAPAGCKCNEIEKEFVILKGSIKKLILDIREQMNSTENPFSNIQMLQMPPPAPVIKEDPIEFEVPKDKEGEKPTDGRTEAKAEVPATREETMAQERKTYTGTGCPYAAKASEPQGCCPLAANNRSQDQGCPLASKAQASVHSCQASTQYSNMAHYEQRQPYPYGCRGSEARNIPDVPYHCDHSYHGERHVCATCGRPVSQGSDGYPVGWSYPYPPSPQRGWPERRGYGQHYEPPEHPHNSQRSYFSQHPEYEPAQYGYPYGSSYTEAGDSRLQYRQSNAGRRRVARVPPEYSYQDFDDRCYREQAWYEPRQPARDYPEQDYYQPVTRPRRVYREPVDIREDRYYEPLPEERDEAHEAPRYRAAPRRRREVYPPTPRYEAEDEFEITEPLPEIDLLPDEPEREEEPLRVRKRARIPRTMPEQAPPELTEQPNPKPRRSRAVKHRG